MTECCSHLFDDFQYEELRTAKPPENRGVYVIRILERGDPVEDIIEHCGAIAQKLGWQYVEKKVMRRIARLRKIGDCPIIYIGVGGEKKAPIGKKQATLKDRYGDFANRHTAMFPLWALLFFKWQLEYGWRIEADNPKQVEDHLRESYREIHGARPALERQ